MVPTPLVTPFVLLLLQTGTTLICFKLLIKEGCDDTIINDNNAISWGSALIGVGNRRIQSKQPTRNVQRLSHSGF